MGSMARVCPSCGAGPARADAEFCDTCGAPVPLAHDPGEYKQVTVLFADVVGSMDLAKALGRSDSATS